MNIILISVGKLKEKYWRSAVEEYTKRLTSFCKLKTIEVADEKCPEKLSKKDMDIVMNREAERIIKKLPANSYLITLEIEGKQTTSEKLSSIINNHMIQGGGRPIIFIIGGSLGLADSIKKMSSFSLSISKMTLPHQLCKVVLLEQIYRAFKIIRGEAYHK